MVESRVESSEPGPTSTIRAAWDVLVFAPLGLGAKIVEDGPAVFAQARRELNNARFIGRMTVSRGVSELRGRIEAPMPEEDDRPVAVPHGADVEAGAETTQGPDVSELALPDYDHLPAIDIVAKLATMSSAERALVEAYESANRQRRTVLGKLAQLATDPST